MKNMFVFPAVPAVLLSALLMGSGCYYFRRRNPFMAVCEWLWAFALLGLCAVDLFMEETVWPSLATVLVVGVCEAIVMVYCIVTPLPNRNTAYAGPRKP